MGSARRSRERRLFRKLEKGHVCPGCGLPATSIDQDDARYWYQPHLEGCSHRDPTLPTQVFDVGGDGS